MIGSNPTNKVVAPSASTAGASFVTMTTSGYAGYHLVLAD